MAETSTNPSLPYGKQFTPVQTPLAAVVDLLTAHVPDRPALETALAARFFAAKRDRATLAMNCYLSLRSYGLVDGDAWTFELTKLGRELARAAGSVDRQHAALARHQLTHMHGVSVLQVVRGRFVRGEPLNRQAIADDLQVLRIDPGGPRGEHLSTYSQWLEVAGVLGSNWNVSRSGVRRILGITEDALDQLADYSAELKAFVRALVTIGGAPPHNSQHVAALADQQSGTRLRARRNLPTAVLGPLQRDGWLTYRKATTGRGAKPSLVTPDKRAKALRRDVASAVATQAALPDPAALRRPFGDLLIQARRARTTHVRGHALEGVSIQLMRMLGARFVGWRVRPEETQGYELDVVAEKANGRYQRILVQSKVNAIRLRQVVDREVAIAYLLERAETIVFVSAAEIGPSPRAAARQYMAVAPLAILFFDGDDLDYIAQSGDLASLVEREYEVVELIRAG